VQHFAKLNQTLENIKVVSIDDLLALLTAFRKQTCYFHYFMYLSIFLFVENKFFFFFLAKYLAANNT